VEAGISETHARLLTRLREFGSPERAAWDKNYLKSSWQHWGVTAPQLDQAIREIVGRPSNEILPLSVLLWRKPILDLKFAATRILAGKSVAPSAEIWQFVLDRMPELDGWAIADSMASVGSRCLTADPRRLDTVEDWVESPHLWTRRASLVFTLPWTKGGHSPERMLGWAAKLSTDPEWFIQKAIGWWLRQLSKRDSVRVRQFLADHGGPLKSLARREATKYL